MRAERSVTDAPVLAFDDLTYTRSQLDALSAGLARILADRGVGRDTGWR